MGCKINTSNLPILHKLPTKTTNSYSSFSLRLSRHHITPSYSAQSRQEPTTTQTLQSTGQYNIKFQTLEACKLGIARYPDFNYNADGGVGVAIGRTEDMAVIDEISASFDIGTLYIPPLMSATTRFLGLPLPPFLKIDIAPELFRGTINRESGQVDLEFIAKFWFSIGRIYKAPPLVVETRLTSEESMGTIRSGRGERMDGEGKCRLVGVATVDPIDDFLMNSFLGLPTECIAELNARISMSGF